MPKLYTRNQGKRPRYYADLRDIGGGQVALIPPGSKRATTDKKEAAQLLADAIRSIEEKAAKPGTLAAFVGRFLTDNPGRVTERWLRETGKRLEKAVAYFGTDRPLDSIRPGHVREWLKRFGHTSNSNQRHYLHALSALYRYAQELEAVVPGYNPVGAMYRKPPVKRTGRAEDFFEIPDAARFLDAARRAGRGYDIIGTYLLTGARRSEVFGLLVRDIDLDVGRVYIRPNKHRSLKRSWSERTVPLWPQLREILTPHLDRHTGGADDLLFPGQVSGRMLTDIRAILRVVAEEAGMPVPRITKFRHTYATARLQTTDNGAPVSLWTVAKELGHKTVARVEDTYGHPAEYRQRGEVVEYR